MEVAGLRPMVTVCGSKLKEIAAASGKLLAAKKPPTALFCANNLVTRHVLHALQALGIHPPHGLALVGFDDLETADPAAPRLYGGSAAE